MYGFRLIDLWSQADAIPRHVRRPRERFLAWLRLYGEVRESPSPTLGAQDGLMTYYFVSPYGLNATLLMNDEGALWLVGEHFFHRVWRDDLPEG